jgi:hypothetical protein
MLRRVALVRTDVSEDFRASFIRVTRIGELGTTLAVTSNGVTSQKTSFFIVTAVKTSNLMKTSSVFSTSVMKFPKGEVSELN